MPSRPCWVFAESRARWVFALSASMKDDKINKAKILSINMQDSLNESFIYRLYTPRRELFFLLRSVKLKSNWFKETIHHFLHHLPRLTMTFFSKGRYSNEMRSQTWVVFKWSPIRKTFYFLVSSLAYIDSYQITHLWFCNQ